MFWLFKKDWHEKKINEKLSPLKDTLKQSFSKIKEDILEIHNKHDKHYSEVDNRISIIMTKLENIENNFFKETVPIQQDLKSKIALTKAQKNLFIGLMTIQYISKKPWISFHTVANEIYPNRKYSEIRSTLSEYINILEELGLIKKTREGKRVFISITRKGLNLTDKEKFKKRLIKLIEQE